MAMSELSIHFIGEKAPKVIVTEYSNFFVVEIYSNTSPRTKFFLYSRQDLVNFKNNCLWAFENPIKTK